MIPAFSIWLIFFGSCLLHYPYSAHASPLSYREALQIAITKSENIKIQSHSVEVAKEQTRIAESRFWPTLTGHANSDRATLPETNLKTYDLSVDLNLFHFGADKAGLNSSQMRERAEKENLIFTQLKIEKDFSQIFWEFIKKTQEATVLRENLKQNEEFLRIAERKYKGGTLPLQQIDKLRIDLTNTEGNLRDKESELERAGKTLEVFLGTNDIELKWPLRDRLKNNEFFKDILQRVAALSGAEHAPQVRAQNFVLQAQEYSMLAAKRSLLPSVDFRFSAIQMETSRNRDSGWSSLVTLSIPPFSGFKDLATYRAQMAQLTIETLEFNLLKRETESLQKIALTQFKARREIAIHRDENLESARRLFQSSQQRFRLGRIEADELNLDQDRVTQAELLDIDGWFQAHTALLELLHSHGLPGLALQ